MVSSVSFLHFHSFSGCEVAEGMLTSLICRIRFTTVISLVLSFMLQSSSCRTRFVYLSFSDFLFASLASVLQISRLLYIDCISSAECRPLEQRIHMLQIRILEGSLPPMALRQW